MDHRKENRIQYGGKRKIKKLEIDFIYLWDTLPRLQAAFWWEWDARPCPFFLKMACGLCLPIPVWGRSLYQEISTDMDEATEAREVSFCKSKGGQQDEQIGHQGLHHRRSDPQTDVLLFCN